MAYEHGSAGAGLLEGLVGGFLMGHDFRTQRDDRKRRLAQEQQAAMQAAEDRRLAMEDRQRSTAIEDVNLRTQHGLAYDPSAPHGAAATPLTRAVQSAYNVPEGFRRVGPSAQERAATEVGRIRKSVGGNLVTAFGLDMSPEAAYDLQERDMLDDYLERTVPKPRAGTVSRGGVSVPNVPLDQIDDVLGQLPPDVPKPADPSDLRREFGGLQTTKDASTVVTYYQRLNALANAPTSGANDLGIVFSYMKLLDPGSTVREGEYASAEQAQGVDDRVLNLYNRLLEGERLSPEARTEFVSAAGNLVQSQRNTFNPVFDRYMGLAQRGGFAPEDVVSDPFIDVLGQRQVTPDGQEIIGGGAPVDPGAFFQKYRFLTPPAR